MKIELNDKMSQMWEKKIKCNMYKNYKNFEFYVICIHVYWIHVHFNILSCELFTLVLLAFKEGKEES